MDNSLSYRFLTWLRWKIDVKIMEISWNEQGINQKKGDVNENYERRMA